MNYCPECGSQLDQDSKFCPNCGRDLQDFSFSGEMGTYLPPAQNRSTPIMPPKYTPSQPQVQANYYKPTDTNGTVALIFGILGFCFLPIIGNIVAIVFGVMARSSNPDSSTGKVGLVLGILGILCWIIFFVSIFTWIFSMFNSYPYYYYD